MTLDGKPAAKLVESPLALPILGNRLEGTPYAKAEVAWSEAEAVSEAGASASRWVAPPESPARWALRDEVREDLEGMRVRGGVPNLEGMRVRGRFPWSSS